LDEVSSTREATHSRLSKSAYRTLDATLCILLPIVYICLRGCSINFKIFRHLNIAIDFFVQDRRFDIVEDFGCRAAIYPSTLAIILIWLPPLFLCIIGFAYFGTLFTSPTIKTQHSHRSFHRVRIIQYLLSPRKSIPAPVDKRNGVNTKELDLSALVFCNSDITPGGFLRLLHLRAGCTRLRTMAVMVSHPRTFRGDRHDVRLDILDHRTPQDRVDMVDYPCSIFGVHRILRDGRDWPTPAIAHVDAQICVQGSGFRDGCGSSQVPFFSISFAE